MIFLKQTYFVHHANCCLTSRALGTSYLKTNLGTWLYHWDNHKPDHSILVESLPLSCWTSPCNIFSSLLSFDNSASSLEIASFACSISFFLIPTPSWYVAIFLFSFSLAALPASQQEFGQYAWPSYSSLPSQQSAN